MDMQLELLPYHYYNTLGFDVELIDYIDHVDDSIVLEKMKPLYKGGGRPPIDARTYFRMHYLYFTRPEITSFRELCRQLKDPKNQAWRNFIGTPNIKDVPVHSSLTHLESLNVKLAMNSYGMVLTKKQIRLGFMGTKPHAHLVRCRLLVISNSVSPLKKTHSSMVQFHKGQSFKVGC